MTKTGSEPELQEVKVRWPGLDEADVRPANSFLLQRSGTNEVIFNIGYVKTPYVWGTPAEQSAQAQRLAKAGVESHVLLRCTLTVDGARQLLEVLQGHLGRHHQ